MFCCASNNLRRLSVSKQFYLNAVNSGLLQIKHYRPGTPPIKLTVEGTIAGQQPNRPKKPAIPKITLLLSPDDSINITTLEEAQQLAKRRDLKLVKIVDVETKTQRPLYKLMSGTEYHQEELKQREQRKKDKQTGSYIKGVKMLILNANINTHDLEIHIKKIVNWISKKYEVRITIHGDVSNLEKSESVYKTLEDSLKDTRFLQKRYKGSDLKFQAMPPKDNDKPDSSNL